MSLAAYYSDGVPYYEVFNHFLYPLVTILRTNLVLLTVFLFSATKYPVQNTHCPLCLSTWSIMILQKHISGKTSDSFSCAHSAVTFCNVCPEKTFDKFGCTLSTVTCCDLNTCSTDYAVNIQLL